MVAQWLYEHVYLLNMIQIAVMISSFLAKVRKGCQD